MESLHIQTKFLQFVSTQLRNFRRRNQFLWNFACPYCNDSSKDSSKARGYCYKNKNHLLSFHCHNCGTHTTFGKFLKHVSPYQYKEYLLETYKNDSSGDVEPEKVEVKPDLSKKEWARGLIHISELSKIHPAVKYVRAREIPEDKLSIFYYTSDFRRWVHEILGMEDKEVPSDPRIVMVECDSFGNLKLVVARAVNTEEKKRYVTLIVDEKYPKLFGLSRLNFLKPIRVVEGAIDSLFLDNCIATLDANLLAYAQDTRIRNPTLIWDNEPRNRDVVRYMKEALKLGETVVIFPESNPFKDINEMFLGGYNVEKLVERNKYMGLTGLLQHSIWKRI